MVNSFENVSYKRHFHSAYSVSLMFYGYISKSAKAWFFDEKRLGMFYKISGGLFVLMGIGLVFI